MRLGDIIDDYCSRCHRLTDHSVVAMLGEEVRKTRCRTYVVVDGRNGFAEEIAAFCGATGIVQRPLSGEALRELLELEQERTRELPTDLRGDDSKQFLPERLLKDLVGEGAHRLIDALTDPETGLYNYDYLSFKLDEELSLECLRIPHFYRAFYVYKYATGLSAAIALSQRVLSGGNKELDAYLGFLKSGCSKDPLDLLRDAGVDMEQPEPVETALTYFGQLVEELDELL